MGDIEPGWYDDTEDPTLARWWDGRAWTDHTVVIADQVSGVEPPPPPASATRFPVPPPPHQWLDDPSYAEEDPEDPAAYGPIEEPAVEEPSIEEPWVDEPWPAEAPTVLGVQGWSPLRDVFDDGGAWQRLDDRDDEAFAPPRRRRGPDPDRIRRFETGDETLGDRVAALPIWVRVGLPILAAVLLVGAVASAGGLGSDGGDDDATRTSESREDLQLLGQAADRALEVADVSWFTKQGFTASIPPTCAAVADDDADRVADRVILLGYDEYTAGRLVAGLEAGAEVFCPEEVAAHPTFFDEVFRLSGASDVTTTTATTAPDITSTTTTVPSTTTTKKRAAPVPTTPTTQPPATTTPTTAPTTTTLPTTTTPTTEPETTGGTTGPTTG